MLIFFFKILILKNWVFSFCLKVEQIMEKILILLALKKIEAVPKFIYKGYSNNFFYYI